MRSSLVTVGTRSFMGEEGLLSEGGPAPALGPEGAAGNTREESLLWALWKDMPVGRGHRPTIKWIQCTELKRSFHGEKQGDRGAE